MSELKLVDGTPVLRKGGVCTPVSEIDKDKQTEFLRWYFDVKSQSTYLNVTKAGLKAGYKKWEIGKLGTALWANKCPPQFRLIREQIMCYRHEAKQALVKFSPDDVLKRLEKIIGWLEHPEEIEKMPRDFKHYVPSILRALELIGKQLNMFTERTENVNINITADMRATRMKEAAKLLGSKDFIDVVAENG